MISVMLGLGFKVGLTVLGDVVSAPNHGHKLDAAWNGWHQAAGNGGCLLPICPDARAPCMHLSNRTQHASLLLTAEYHDEPL